MTAEKRYKRIGWVVQVRRSFSKPWSDRLQMQGKTEKAAWRKYHSRYKEDALRRGLARLEPVYVEVQDG